MVAEFRPEQAVPPAVAGMLAHYRSQLAEQGYDWGREIEPSIVPLLRLADRCDVGRWNAAFAGWKAAGTLADPIGVLLRALLDPLPSGIAVLRDDGRLVVGQPLPYTVARRSVRYHVIVPASSTTCRGLEERTVGAEWPYLEVEGRRVRAADVVASGWLRLRSDAISRWTVLDARGGGWFPDSAVEKYDSCARPYFHGDDLLVEVPAGPVTVTVSRGCEYRPATASLEVAAGDEIEVDLAPQRLYDAAARGWYGGDLHVHMNYTGDLVWEPQAAVLAARGEGLHLINLVAANYSTARIYDREVLEAFAGRDLPGSDAHTVARVGVEYRNDMLGHFHALNASAPPTRYHTGHPRSGEPDDWPPNADVAAELRSLGATIGYTHPLAVTPASGDLIDQVFAEPRVRSYEARELVADAALGLVDSLDLMTGNIAGNEFLYHRLIGCGLRLAATAGTDVMLSRARGRLTSNPPGWSRAYANLGDAALSARAWQDAVRAGRTFATNGPWLELDVDGWGPGDTVACTAPRRVRVAASVVGDGVERLEIVGPAGSMACLELSGDSGEGELVTTVDVKQPTWFAAVAHGGPHPLAVGGQPHIYAHTSALWIDLGGRSVARREDAAWCLLWLDALERLATRRGHFSRPGQRSDLSALLDRARAFYNAIMACE